MKRG
ncbi:Protein of unknown function [Thermobacillus xylanilyticus]|jgi:hypothetical protein